MRITLLLGVVLLAASADATAQWLHLKSSTFEVVSELNEEQTSAWAGEFDAFIRTLNRRYGVRSERLSPLTIVLFKSDKGFKPYRPTTQSGQAKKVAGLFGSRPGWSVIGLGKERRSTETRWLIQHEAAHWFLDANTQQLPLWFNEGYAQVVSTFEITNGVGTFGDLIPSHISILRRRGLQALESLLQVDQDTALHHDERFYPQAWLFVHYGFFSDSVDRENDPLSNMLRLQRTLPLQDAFESAFGKPLEEVDADLERYLNGGSFNRVAIEIPPQTNHFELNPADPARLELALGQLALVGGNQRIAEEKARNLVMSWPSAPEGYALQAYVQLAVDNLAEARKSIAKSIELGSDDSGIYLLDAQTRFREQFVANSHLDQTLDPASARIIVDRIRESLLNGVRIQDSMESFTGLFTLALLSLDALSEEDLNVLNALSASRPRDGRPLLVQAAHLYRSRNLAEARSLLRAAQVEPRSIPANLGLPVKLMEERWISEDLAQRFHNVGSPEDLKALDRLLVDALEEPSRTPQFYEWLERLRNDVRSYGRHLEASRAAERGSFALARARWQETLDDPESSKQAKLDAKRALERLASFEADSGR